MHINILSIFGALSTMAVLVSTAPSGGHVSSEVKLRDLPVVSRAGTDHSPVKDANTFGNNGPSDFKPYNITLPALPSADHSEKGGGVVATISLDTEEPNAYLVTIRSTSEVESTSALGKIYCKTSWASPTFDEINYCIGRIAAYASNTCTQDNIGDSKCSTMHKWKGGDISLCGRYKNKVPCQIIAEASMLIKEVCGDWPKSRAGGELKFSRDIMGGNMRAVVH